MGLMALCALSCGDDAEDGEEPFAQIVTPPADTGIGGGNGVERQLDIGINLVGPRIRRGKKVVKRRIGVRYQGGIFNIVQIAQKILAALVNQLLGTGENRAVDIAVHNLTGERRGCRARL